MRTTAASHEGARASTPGIGTALRLRIELWLAVVFMALAFGAGIAVGVISQPAPSTAPVVGVAPAGDQSILAPPLTQEQLQQGLPSGHPDIGAGPSDQQGGGTKAGSQTAGGSKQGAGADSSGGSP